MGQLVVDRTATPGDADARSSAVVALLLSDGVIGESQLVERPDGNPFEGRVKWVKDKRIWKPGPRAETFKQSHLELVVGWQLHGPDDMKPSCPSCRAALEWDAVYDAVAGLEDGESALVCPRCRASADVRTADLGAGAVGALAYLFASWMPLPAGTIARMQDAVPGSRLQVVGHDD